MEKHKKSYIISSFEVDFKQKLRIHSLFNLFQDLADEHAEKLGLSYTFCSQNGLGWVGGAYHVKISRLPTWGEKITIETWPSGTTAAAAIRDFKMMDDDGNVLVCATSQWVLIDINRLRPLPIAKHLPHYDTIPERALDSDFAKILTPEISPNDISFPVHTDDIDLNHHVNNALYPTWALDGVPEAFYNENQVTEIQVTFRRPARLGDVLVMKTYRDGGQSISVMGTQDGTIEFARVRLVWQAR